MYLDILIVRSVCLFIDSAGGLDLVYMHNIWAVTSSSICYMHLKIYVHNKSTFILFRFNFKKEVLIPLQLTHFLVMPNLFSLSCAHFANLFLIAISLTISKTGRKPYTSKIWSFHVNVS